METSHANYGNEPISSVHKGRCFLASQRYVLRHLRRSTVKSISAVAIAMCFLLALGWINQKIMHDKNEIERQYASIVVDVEIVKNNTSVTVTGGGGVIFGTTIEAVLSSGFIQNYHLEAQAPREFIAPMAEENQDSEYFWDNTRRINDILLSGFNNSEAFFSGTGKYVTTEYASGYDETLFAEDWTKEQIKAGGKIPVMISASMIERIGISLGDDIYVMDGRGGGSMFLGTVAGQYEGGFAIGEEVVLLPLSALEVMEEGNNNALGYSVAKFIIDSSKNKELSTFRKEMKELVSSPGAGLLDLNFVLWDEELRRVVEPLDKNLQLMAVLYPVTLALSVLIAAGISMLLVIQNAREAAIMRVLGIGRMWVCAILVAEQLLMSLLGVTIGFVTLVFLQGNTEESLTSVYLMCATLYLAGCAVGAVLTAISVTNRKPLDLLQVKE